MGSSERARAQRGSHCATAQGAAHRRVSSFSYSAPQMSLLLRAPEARGGKVEGEERREGTEGKGGRKKVGGWELEKKGGCKGSQVGETVQ